MKAVDVLEQFRDEFGPVDPPVRPAGDSTPRTFAEGAYPKDSRIAKAYEVALDVRKFEIELYWKRAGYFWLLLAALAGSLGLILTGGNEKTLPEARRETLALFVSCAGAVLAVCWSIVNRASKSWQRNWEFHVDVLEDRVVGPLYKTTMFKGMAQPISYSISEANFWISAYFAGLFVVCVGYFSGVGRFDGFDLLKFLIIAANAGFIGLLVWKTRTFQDSGALWLPLSYHRRTLKAGRRCTAPGVEERRPAPTQDDKAC